MNESREIPEFGQRVDCVTYHPRPGAYAVIVDNDRVALIRTPDGLFLPGGGIDPNESTKDALVREVIEETGWRIDVGETLGEAIEYVCAEGERYFSKECTFFAARMVEQIGGQIETDHSLEWMPFATATMNLSHASQAWALTLMQQ